MFYCQSHNGPSRPSESPIKVIVQTRPKRYINVVNKKTIESFGSEIVREIQVCKDCYKESSNGTS
jgi:hypothetical protein